ncbi:uncharacterized protein LOC121376501 [Gigantopelta aegis]|uniref:uncharacterized protein LOC121376501 n=1 Tax=Gigantopelta aegis TaxID=1735272 RepID=UPI001B88C840|nr:uncharacterized protein LOC121376501 [Gigantopelta aegis]
MEARVVVLLAVSAGVFAGPLNPTNRDDPFSCSTRCTDSSKFRYQPGTTYEYGYDAQTQTSMGGASEDQANIRITAKAKVEVLSKCEFALKLTNVALYRSDADNPSRLTHGDNSGDFQRSLEYYPLKFSFQDGVVDELCPDESESHWALNIKRGILTAFQNSMRDLRRDQRVHETDVTGSCVTDYYVTQRGWQSLTVKKVKALEDCTDRHGYKTAIHAMPYKIASAVQSMPLMKSSHECDQVIKTGGYLQKSSCRETHVFRPFSKDNNGAITESTQVLELLRSYNSVSTSKGYISKRTKLTFQHVYGTRDEDTKRRDASQKLEDLCQASADDIRPEVPGMFSELVYIMREMDARSLDRLFEQVKRGDICRDNTRRTRKFFVDAIPMVGTSASLRLMRQMILSQAVDTNQANMWLTSLAFIQNPTREMLEEIEPLMEFTNVKAKARLSISSLVNNYCNNHATCSDDREVMKIILDLENDVGACDVTDSNLIDTLQILRAIGNIGHSERLSFSLEKCFNNKKNPAEIRVAALDAFRRLPCSTDRNNIMEVFLNTDEDSELRIAAYLAVMQCPVETFLDQVRSSLESEQVDQVGSFVWSHLINLMDTSSPLRQNIREILEDETLKKDFDLDKRKFSRNYEGSFFLEKINAGAMVESNVIWSSRSFLPRSAMVNFTVDLFGQSVNLLEIGGRVEGLEYLLESYLGPEGLFREQADTKGYADTKTIKKEKMERQKKLYNQLKDEFRGALYLRVFGNELLYKHFDTLDSSTSGEKFNILEYLIKLSKNQDYTYTQSFMFLDSSLVIPTSAGLPLNLTVNGTVTVDMTASGKFDVRKFQTQRSLLIDGHVQPSGAVEIVSTMSVDAFVTKVGLKMISTLHSSSSVKGRLELVRGKIFSLEFDLPKDKIEIFDFKSRFFITHDNHQREQKMIEANRKYKLVCWGTRLAKLTGVELCGEMGFPNASMNTKSPYFPFTGPVNIAFVLHKRDIHYGYKMVIKASHNKETTYGQIAFDTPGSKVNRALSLDMSLHYKTKEVEIALLSPWKKASIKGDFTNTDKLKKVTGKLVVDDIKEYFISTEIPIEKKGKKTVYSPDLKVKWPYSEGVHFSGVVSLQSLYENVDADLTLAGITEFPVKLQGSLVNKQSEKGITGSIMLRPQQEYSIAANVLHKKSGKRNPQLKLIPTLSIKSPEFTLLSVAGTVDFKKNKSLKTNIIINVDKYLKKAISVTSTVTRSENAKVKRVKYKGYVNLKCQFISTKLSGTFDYAKKTCNTKLTLDYSLPQVAKNSITVGMKVINRTTESLKKYFLNGNIDVKKNPEYNLMFEVDLNHNRQHSEVNLKAKHGNSIKNKKDIRQQLTASATFSHKNFPAARGSIDYTLRTEYPNWNINYLVKGDHGWSKNSFTSSLDIRKKKKSVVEVLLRLRDQSKRLKKLDATFNVIAFGQQITLFSNFTETSRREYLHIFNFQHEKGHKSTAVTRYKESADNLHELSTDVLIDGYSPLHVDALAKLNWQDFRASVQGNLDNQRYGVDVSSKTNKRPYGKWTGLLRIPSRTMKTSIEGGKKGNKYIGNAEVAWDVDKDEEAKITVESDFTPNVQKGEAYKIAGKIHLTTPFKNARKLSGEMLYANKNKHFTYTTKLDWGGKNKEMSVNVDLVKPFDINNVGVLLAATTPFEGFSDVEVSLQHKNDKTLHSQLKGKWGPKYFDIRLEESHMFAMGQVDVEGQIEWKSSISRYQTLSASFKHNHDRHSISTQAEAYDNGNKYSSSLKASYLKIVWDFKMDGTIAVTYPGKSIVTTIHHSHSPLMALKSTFYSKWDHDQSISIDISASHENIVNRKINGVILIQTPWDEAKDIEININHEQGTDFVRSITFYKHDKRTKGKIDVSYKKTRGEVEFDFILMNPYTQDLKSKLNTRYGKPFKTGHFELEWSHSDKISVDGSFSIDPKTYSYSGNFRIVTPFEVAHSIVIKTKTQLEGKERVSDFFVEYGNRKYFKAETRSQFDDVKKIRGKIDTSLFENVTHIEVGFEMSGAYVSGLTASADFEIQPAIGKISTSLSWTMQPEFYTKLRIDTPFKEFHFLEVTSSGQQERSGSTRRHLEIKYHPRNVLRMDTTYNIRKWQDLHTSVEIRTPFSVLPKLEADLSFKKTNTAMEGKALVKTPFKKVKDISLAFTHLQTEQVIQTHVETKFSGGKHIEADLHLLTNDGFDGTFSFQSPYDPVTDVHISIKHEGTRGNFSSHAELNYSNKRFEADANFLYGANMVGSFAIKTPYKGFEDLKVEFTKQGPLRDFDIKGAVNYDNMNKKIEVSLKQKHIEDTQMFIAATFKSPYTMDFSLVVDHNGKNSPISNNINMTLGIDYLFESDNRISYDDLAVSVLTDVSYKWKRRHSNIKLSFRKDLQNINMEMTADKEFKLTSAFKKGNKIEGDFQMKLPLKVLPNLGFSFDHTGSENRFVTNSRLNWGNDEFIEGKLDFFRVKTQRVEATLDVNSHFLGYESSTVHYEHQLKKTKLKAVANLAVGSRGPYALELTSTKTSPEDIGYIVKVNTPHTGYKHLKLEGKIRQTNNRIFVSGETEVGKHGTVSFESTIDINSDPKTLSIKVRTPFENFASIDIFGTLRGRLDDFKTTFSFHSPRTGSLSGEMSSQYISPYSVNVQLALKTEYERFSNLKVVMRRSRSGPEYHEYAEIVWNKSKPVTVDIVYVLSDDEVSCEISITTPFDECRSFSCKVDHMYRNNKLKDLALITHNGRTYFDADITYEFSSGHQTAINIRQPQPLEATMSYRNTRTEFINELFLNWDKRDPEGNIRFVIEYNNRLPPVGIDGDFQVKVIHPARVLGVEGTYRNTPKHLHKKALITWDQAQGGSLAYDMEWLDQSTWNRDGQQSSVMLVLPMRSIKASGSFSNTSTTRSMDVSFLWDADRDQRKQVGLKVDYDNRGKSRKTDLLLHLPAINKDYKLGTDVILNHGNTLFDGRLDFSYSRNSKKTIVLTSKVEKIYWNQMTGDRNLSVAFGVTHPITDIDIQMRSHMGHIDSTYSGGMDIRYLTAERIQKNIALRGELDKLRRQIDLQMMTPIQNIRISGKMDTKLPYHMTVKKVYGNSRSVNADLVIDPRSRTLEFTMVYDEDKPQDKVRLSAKYINDSAIQAEMHREQDSQVFSESLIAIRLNSSHILHTKVTWRPMAIVELQRYLSMKSQIMSYKVSELMKAVNEAIATEVVGKYNALARELSEELEPTFMLFEKEMENIELSLRHIQTQMRRAYMRNDLYIRDMEKSVNIAFSTLMGSFRSFVKDFRQFCDETEIALTQFTNALRSYPMAQKYAGFVNEVVSKLKMARETARATMYGLSAMLEDMSDNLYRVYLDRTRKLGRKVNEILNHPDIKMLQRHYNTIRSNMNALPDIDYSKYASVLDNHIQTALEKLQMRKTYNNILSQTNEVIKTQMNAVINDPDIQKAHTLLNEMYQQGKWAYNYWSLDGKVRGAMMKVYELTKDALFKEINDLKDTWMDLDKSRIVVFDPQRGELQFDLYLPFPLQSLAHPVDYSFDKYITKATRFVHRYIPGTKRSIWSKYLTPLDTVRWAQPFDGYASVVGNQHFITFDKTHFDFAGRCSYVLVRDMVDDNFTVVLNYNNNYRNPKKESILVMLRGVNIEVNQKSEVKVNDRRVELPFSQKKIVALKEDHVIRIKDGSGLLVEVDPLHNIHTIHVSYWYHGRTAGVLGTYDNDKTNEMMTSSHEVVDDVTSFVNSWEIGKKSCRSMNAARKIDVDVDEDGKRYTACASLFKEPGSWLAPCYSQVEPGQFFDLCLGYIERLTLSEGKCLAATQYHHLCRQAGVYVQIPTECVSCSTINQEMFYKDIELKVGGKNPVPHSADVVIVYEEKKTKMWTPITLGQLVQEVNNALTALNLRDNMFGLVGYGGPNQLVKEHVHTFDGQIFGKAVSFLKGVEDIQYSSSRVAGNAMDALRYTTHLPFRTGVSKIIIFIPALACETSVISPYMENRLKSNGFVMHVLRNYKIEVGSDIPLRNNVVFGMDKSQFILFKNRNNRNPDLYNGVVLPTDKCSSLALATNGSIFDSSHMTSTNTRLQRDFLRKFAARVGVTAAPPLCQMCSCEHDGYGQGKSVCKPCDRSFSVWNYIPNWWSNNRIPGRLTDFDPLQDYLALDAPLRLIQYNPE